MSIRTTQLIALLALFACVFGFQPAEAKGLGGSETFDNSSAVSDAELSKMRGGFLSVNGLLINFNFFSNVQVGVDTISNVSINTDNLAQAALTANQIQDLLQPQIIQNMDDNVLISIQQSLNLDIMNAAVLNQISQVDQLQYQQVLN